MTKDKTITRVSSSFNEFKNSDCETVIQPPFSILNKSIGIKKKGTPYLASTTRPRVVSQTGTDFTLGRSALPVDPCYVEPASDDDILHWWKLDEGAAQVPNGQGADTGNSSNTSVLFHNAAVNVPNGDRTGQVDVVEFTGINLSFTRNVAVDGGGNFTAFGEEIYLRTGDQFTVSLWAYIPDAYPSSTALLWGSARNENMDDGLGMYYHPNDPSQGLHFWCGRTNASSDRVSSVPAPSLNTWFHIACVLDVSGGIHKAYLDGVAGSDLSSGDPAVLPPEWGQTGHPIYFNFAALGATHVNAPFHFFNVQISDFRWYNKALSAGQIQQLASE